MNIRDFLKDLKQAILVVSFWYNENDICLRQVEIENQCHRPDL